MGVKVVQNFHNRQPCRLLLWDRRATLASYFHRIRSEPRKAISHLGKSKSPFGFVVSWVTRLIFQVSSGWGSNRNTGLVIQFQIIGSVAVARIGKPETALRIESKIVRAVESFLVTCFRNDSGCTVPVVSHNPPAAALAPVQLPCSVEHESIGTVRFFPKDGAFTALRRVAHNAAVRDVGKEHRLPVPSGPFSKT